MRLLVTIPSSLAKSRGSHASKVNIPILFGFLLELNFAFNMVERGSLHSLQNHPCACSISHAFWINRLFVSMVVGVDEFLERKSLNQTLRGSQAWGQKRCHLLLHFRSFYMEVQGRPERSRLMINNLWDTVGSDSAGGREYDFHRCSRNGESNPFSVVSGCSSFYSLLSRLV